MDGDDDEFIEPRSNEIRKSYGRGTKPTGSKRAAASDEDTSLSEDDEDAEVVMRDVTKIKKKTALTLLSKKLKAPKRKNGMRVADKKIRVGKLDNPPWCKKRPLNASTQNKLLWVPDDWKESGGECVKLDYNQRRSWLEKLGGERRVGVKGDRHSYFSLE